MNSNYLLEDLANSYELRGLAFICGSILAVGLGLAQSGIACELPPLPGGAKSQTVYRVDEAKSLLRFDAKAFMHDVVGKTSKVQGTFRLSDPDRFTDAEACVRINAATLDTGNSTRDGIMRDDHLETGKFPTIDFVLKQIESVKRQTGTWEAMARGTLFLHGVSREIQVPVRVRQAEDAVQLTGQTSLKMTDYRIPIPKFLFLTLEDQVMVSFDVVARRVP